MEIRLHPHAEARMVERGASKEEVLDTVSRGELSPTGHGRARFRRNFVYNNIWQGRHFTTKQVEAIAVRENGDWLVITVLTRFF